MHETRGSCHCGNLQTVFRSAIMPADIPVRACQCSFCRKHNVRAVSDPSGGAEIIVRDPAKLSRYRFGHGAADFFVCAHCGVYVAAVMEEDSAAYATLMVNAFDNQTDFVTSAEPIDYAGEGVEGRRERRRRKWTPATIIIGDGAASADT